MPKIIKFIKNKDINKKSPRVKGEVCYFSILIFDAISLEEMTLVGFP